MLIGLLLIALPSFTDTLWFIRGFGAGVTLLGALLELGAVWFYLRERSTRH